MINLYIALYQIILGVVIIAYTLFILTSLLSTHKSFSAGAPPLPTPKKKIIQALKLANPDTGEKFYDFGAGWGRVVALADRKFELKAKGFEFSRMMYMLANLYLFLVQADGKIIRRNFLETPLPDKGLIFTYTSPSLMQKLEKKIEKEQPKNLKIVSYQFQFPNLEAAKQREDEGESENIYLYKVQHSH